jgi:hypothetical protein
VRQTRRGLKELHLGKSKAIFNYFLEQWKSSHICSTSLSNYDLCHFPPVFHLMFKESSKEEAQEVVSDGEEVCL